MNSEDSLFQKRLTELAEKAYQNSQYIFTGFLSMQEIDLYYRMERELSYVPVTLYGGTRDCERVMIRFGDEDMCGYVEPFPICCVEISPVMEKFAQQLSHRDYLGALMNLGIERNTLGDMIVDGKTAYLFCTERMAPYIVENLETVRHTHVKCRITEEFPESTMTKFDRKTILVSSERIDGVIAKLCNLSRSQVIELFRTKRIFVNGRVCENNSGILKQGDKVSVRGFGKFVYLGKVYETKKGKLSVEADVYV